MSDIGKARRPRFNSRHSSTQTHGSAVEALDATAFGAYDHLVKPLRPEGLQAISIFSSHNSNDYRNVERSIAGRTSGRNLNSTLSAGTGDPASWFKPDAESQRASDRSK
ncbi:MAG TPA: hypothetical protein VJ023_08250 [Pyrinomonadaceae bacterium]|nr:hypothetical protein [Pyrinomonadaceae bacterium]